MLGTYAGELKLFNVETSEVGGNLGYMHALVSSGVVGLLCSLLNISQYSSFS